MSIETQDHSTIEAGSSKSFGIVFATVFVIIGLFPLFSGSAVRLWALLIGGVFLLLALSIPRVLQPLNLLWFRFGLLLGKVISPVVMFVIYVTTVLPIGVTMRLCRKDLLRLKLDGVEPSYWIERSPPGPEPESLEEQF
ncbi:MAG: SxtJ family membrane protein [Gammaproteobacteria bacterium]|nr:SxtJ family membrane protein [Gammaproteobacteria bacterium]